MSIVKNGTRLGTYSYFNDGNNYVFSGTNPTPITFDDEVSYSGYNFIEGLAKFIELNDATVGGIYQYTSGDWTEVNTQFTATIDDVYGETFWGSNGIQKGTLGDTIANNFQDAAAGI